MKVKKFYMMAAALLSLLLLTYCDHAKEGDEINEPVLGSGKVTAEYRSLPEFRGIRIQNYGNVFVTQSSEQSVRIECDDNVIRDVVTSIDNGILSVSLSRKSYSGITLHVYVSAKIIQKLLIDGAGNIVVEKPISCDDMNCSINGSGNISLKGFGNSMTCTINGQGDINAFEFFVSKCTALINGSGNCELNVSKELIASITGQGQITYTGNPVTVNSSISGTGKVVKK